LSHATTCDGASMKPAIESTDDDSRIPMTDEEAASLEESVTDAYSTAL
jgi:hypothetical protein